MTLRQRVDTTLRGAFAAVFPAISIAAFCSVAMAPASAQETAFDNRLAEALEPAGDRAVLLDCAGLFRAFRLFVGSETEVGVTAGLREQDLATIATVIWQAEDDIDIDSALAAIVPLIGAATELYLDRLVANDADTGSVLDDALERKLAFCGSLRDSLMEAVE